MQTHLLSILSSFPYKSNEFLILPINYLSKKYIFLLLWTYAYVQSNAHFHNKEIKMKTLQISMSQKDYITIVTLLIPISSANKVSYHQKNNPGLNLTYKKKPIDVLA